jgi:hypothetical protein
MTLNISKKIFSVLLISTFFLCLNVLPAQAAGVCSGNIYWGNTDARVGRAIITNSAIASTNDSFIVSEAGTEIYNLVEDANYFYFSDSSNFLWKTNKTTLVRTNVFGGSVGYNLSALAVANGKLYIGGLAVIGGGTTTYENKFYRYDIASDGTMSNRIDLQAVTGFTKRVYAVAVDNNYIYYISKTETGHTTVPNYIGRANLDGTSANNSFITIGNSEEGTDLQVNSNYIYWADYATAIRRADIDGRNITTLLTSSRMHSFVIDSSYIYLDDWNGSAPYSIARANIDGTGLDENYISTSAKPSALLASTTNCAAAGGASFPWVGDQSINCPAPNPWVKEKLGFASNAIPVLVSAENTIGKTITQGSYDALKSSGVEFDTVSTQVSTATETLPIYGCKDKLLSGKVNQPIQFIAGGYTLQSDAHGYINTSDLKWHDTNGVTLYTNTAAFMHTIKFTQTGKYVVVLTEQPDTSRGLIPTYGVRSIRFVINVN